MFSFFVVVNRVNYKKANFIFSGQSNNTVLVVTLTIVTLFILTSSLLISYLTFSIKERRIRIRYQNEEKFFALSTEDTNEDDVSKSNMCLLNLIQKNELMLSSELGKGAFGTVYEGYYKPNGRSQDKIKVAIKILNKLKVVEEEKARELNNQFLNVIF